MIKRLISLLLVFALVFSVFPPVPVFAAETTERPEAPVSEDLTGRIQDTTTVTMTLEGEEKPAAEPEEGETPDVPEESDTPDAPAEGNTPDALAEDMPNARVENTSINVLLIQEAQPWDKTANITLLENLLSQGYIDEYTVTTMEAAGDLDLSQYMMVMIPSDQPQSVYDTYANQVSDKINTYVANGGILYFSVCDHGWAEGSLDVDLPGGVKRSHDPYNNNHIADSDHPIVTGELTNGTALTDAMLNGVYCSHEVFVESTLPENTHVILRSGRTAGEPTLVAYPYGSGCIVASGLTWEYYYGANGSTGAFAANSYDDVIVYAMKLNTYDDTVWPIANLHTVSVGSRSVSMVWDPAVNRNVIGYKVYRDGELVGDVAECAFAERTLDGGTSYTYEVVGYTAGGLEMDPASLTVSTWELPKVLDIFTDYNDAVGGTEGTLYARVNAGAALEGAKGAFVIIDNSTEEIIGEYLVDYAITSNEAIYQTEWDISNLESGVYTIGFRLVDPDGESDIHTEEISVCNDAPAVIVGLMAQGDLDAIYLSWSLAAEYDVNIYRVYRRVSGEEAWTLLTEKTGNRNDTAYTDRAVEPDVVYEYSVTAVSRFGLECEKCEPVSGALAVDRENPVVTRLSPARNSLLAGTVQVSAAATDNDVVASIALYYQQGENEPVLFASGSGASITAQLDTTLLADGNVELYAIATDAAGNKSAGIPVYTCIVDNTAPACVTDLSYTSSATAITLAWSYIQDDDFNRFVVETLGEDGSWSTAATSSRNLGVNLTGLKPDTSYTYRVYVVDHAGNVSAYSEELTAATQGDTTAPVVSAINPGAGYHNQDFQVRFTMKDDYALAGVEIQVSHERLNWETVAVETFDDLPASKTYSYTVRVDNYPEDGSVYVRAVPVDSADNRGLESVNAPFAEYVLDRTAPNIPDGISAKPSGNSICIMWNDDPAKETARYHVLRSDAEDGDYTVIASDLTSISCYDRTAQADTVYWYRIQGQDTAGNISQSSAPVSASWTHTSDTEKPLIHSIGPADGSKLGGTKSSISVLAQDDRILNRIEAVFTNQTQGTAQTLTASGDGTYYLTASLSPDCSAWTSGDRIQVSVVAYDNNSNASDTVTFSYVMDLTAPAVKDVNASLDGSTVTLTWKAGSNSDDLNGYYMYRSTDSGWTRIGTRAAREDGSYTFTDTLSADGTYTYRVTAVDLMGNQADYTSNTITYTRPRGDMLNAEFVTDRQQQQNVEYLFDASRSWCEDGRIVSYLFDFGDGTTSSKARAIHAYQETGTYTVTLTITDDTGYSESVSNTVEVKERASLGVLTVKVVDDSGNPVSGAPVYFDMGSGSPVIKYADAGGKVSFTSNAGTYTVGAYTDGYLPVTKQVILAGNTTRTAELVMVEQPIVTGEFDVKRMTLEEIVAAGIDLTDPANQHCVSVTIRLSFEEKTESMHFVQNANGDTVSGSNTLYINDRVFAAVPLEEDDWYYTGDLGGEIGGIPLDPDVVAILEIPINASFLKEFFNVKLHIMNNATEEFTLVDNVVQLNVPDGMTFMSESQSSDVETLGALKGQQTWTLSWIIRGDEEGLYNLTADYSGTLDGFNAAVRTSFRSPYIHVYGSSAIHVVINLSTTIQYQSYYMDVGIKNVSDMDLYMPSIDIPSYLARAFYPHKSEEEDNEDILTASRIGMWIENEYGFEEAVKEAPNVLSSGETLFHCYSFHHIDSEDKVLALKDWAITELKNMGIDQVEVNIRDIMMYPDDEASAERIMKAAEGPARAEYLYLTTPTNFMYYNVGYEDENSVIYQVGSTSKDVLDVALGFNFDCITKNTDRAFFRAIVSEMMSDDVLADYVDAQMSKEFSDAVGDILKAVSNTMKAMGNDVDDVDKFVQQIMQDDFSVYLLAEKLQDEGCSTGFMDRLGHMIAAGGLNLSYEAAMEILQDSSVGEVLNLSLAEKLGDVSDVFDFGATLANGWSDAIDAANAMLMLKYAQEESTYFLRTILEQIEATGNGGSWMHQEAISMLSDLENANKIQREAMIRVLSMNVSQALLEVGTEKLAEVVAEESAEYMAKTFGLTASDLGNLAVAYKVLQVVYQMTDYTLNLSDYYDSNDQMIAMMTLNAIFTCELNDAQTPVDKVHALKYIIKTNLMGERMFVQYIAADEDRAKDFEEMYGYDIDTYRESVYYSIQHARDVLYHCVFDESELPEAPESLTFDYLNEHTVETFDNTYEYTIDGGVSWTTCGDETGAPDYIYVSGKTVSQSLRVRLKAAGANRAGANAVLLLNAMPRHRYATAAGAAGQTCFAQGLNPNTTYQLIRAEEAEPRDINWSESVRLTTDSEGNLSGTVTGSGDYLLYRLPATSDSFPSAAHSILLSRDGKVQISAGVQGAGSVLRNGQVFTSCVADNGELVTLTVSFDKTTTRFKGWYVSGTLYSTDETLTIEAVEDLHLVAVFEKLPLTVTAGETSANYGDLQSAIDVLSGCTEEDLAVVQLMADVSADTTVSISGGTFTLDLNNQTYTNAATGFDMEAGTNVTFENGSVITNNQGIVVGEGAAAVIKSGTYEAGGVEPLNSGIAMMAEGSFTDGTIAVVNFGSTTITGGTFYGKNVTIVCAGDTTITGGTFTPGQLGCFGYVGGRLDLSGYTGTLEGLTICQSGQDELILTGEQIVLPAGYGISADGSTAVDTMAEEQVYTIIATCDHSGNTNTLTDCTQGVICSVCGAAVVEPGAHNFENGACTGCGESEQGKAGVMNTTTNTVYNTLAEALEAAQEGETVVLLQDVTENTVMVTPGVTLDLNGFTLTADYLVGFEGGHVVDTVGTGKLVAEMNRVVLDENNAMIPVYDGTGYVFAKAGFAIEKDTAYEGEGTKINAVACPANMEVVELLKNGCADNNIKIVIRLTWDTGDAIGSQEFIFNDEVVAQVFSSNDGSWSGYSKMFSMVVTGFGNIENLTARIAIVSGTNAAYISSTAVDIT